MAKSRTVFSCQSCGTESPKWMGRCHDCGAWNSFVEVNAAPTSNRQRGSPQSATLFSEIGAESGGEWRVRTGIGEFDTTLGGGLVAGSLVLLGGDPGVGKSTLLLAAMQGFCKRGLTALYASGEESLAQLKNRADRLGVTAETLWMISTTDFDAIEAEIRAKKPAVVIVDSVQTVSMAQSNGMPGSVNQVREVAQRSMELAKGLGVSILIVGHITKSGDLAGPKVLEHLVDTVLHFEGDGRSSLRILRALKNRFGPAGALGLFEMAEVGLKEVPDASARLLDERVPDTPGTAVLCAHQGGRALLAEVQALVGRPGNPTPARTCVGVDRSRVLMLCAVLQKAGIDLHERDVFVNAAGGIRLHEPSADLAIAMAIASSAMNLPLPAHTAVFGEVGLVGEVRATTYPTDRVREAQRHGFRRVVVPTRVDASDNDGIALARVRGVAEAVEQLRPT